MRGDVRQCSLSWTNLTVLIFLLIKITSLAVIDAYPNTATVEQGTTLILVCRVVGVPSTTVLSYQWTCPGGYCDAGGVDPEWAARIQQDNILVVNILTQNDDNGTYTCIVQESTQQVVRVSYRFTVAGECHGGKLWIICNISCVDYH